MYAAKKTEKGFQKIKLLVGTINAFQYVKKNEKKFKARELVVLGEKHEIETLYMMGYPKYYLKEYYE